jgi:microcystin degradation protein MlrC
MKIAIGALMQETNTFSPEPGALDHFRSVHFRGDDLLKHLGNCPTEISGFYDVLAETGAELIPTVAAKGVSAGRLTLRTYETLRDELLAEVARAGRLDAVLLSLHGALSLEDDDDGDGRLLDELREVIGAECLVVVTHDLHANLTRRRVALCDAIVGYKTAPHVDQRETGAHAARILLRSLSAGERPRNLLRKIPIIAPSVRMNTAIDPLRAIIGRARVLESEPSTPAISVFWMQPWLDVAEAGAAVNVVCFGDDAQARAARDELSEVVWETRHGLDVELWMAEEAIRDALKQNGHPCVFADTGDAQTGGAPGDSNFLLDAFLAEGADQCERLTLMTIFDPEAARAMHAAGEGAELTLTLGGAVDRAHFTPREYRGRVGRLSDGRFVNEGRVAHGKEVQIGRAGVFEIGAIRVLAHESPAFSLDPAIFRHVGLAPEQAQIVVAKSPTMFRANYEPMAHGIYEIESPGVCDVNLRRLDFQRLPRPIYPFDPEAEVERAFRKR